jgi:hypothetical protein
MAVELMVFSLVAVSAGYVVYHMRKILTRGETDLRCHGCPAFNGKKSAKAGAIRR